MSQSTRSEAVAANVRAELARRQMTATQAAETLGMSQQAISRRLTGVVPFDVDELQRLADVLETPISGLLGGDELVPA